MVNGIEHWTTKRTADGDVKLFLWEKFTGAPGEQAGKPAVLFVHGSSMASQPTFDLSVPGRPHSIYETQHVTTQLGLVEAGLGVAAVPAMAMPGADHPLLVSVPLVDPVVSRKVGLIRRQGRSLSPAAAQLYGFLLAMKGKRIAAAAKAPRA